MANSVIASSGGAYTSLQGWEDAIGGALSATEDQTASVEEAFAAGALVINNAMGTTYTMTITVPAGSSYRFYEQSAWPEDMAGAAAAAARANYVNITANQTVVIEYLAIDTVAVAASIQIPSGATGGTLDIHHVLVNNRGGSTGVRCAVSGPTLDIRQSAIINVNDFAMRCQNGTFNAENVLVYGHDSGNSSFHLVGRSGGTMTCDNCVVFEEPWREFADCFNGTINGDNNMSSDATAPGTTNYRNVKVPTWMTDLSDGSQNAKPTVAQVWDDDALRTAGCESGDLGDFTSNAGGIQAATAAAQSGTYGLETTDVTSLERAQINLTNEQVDGYYSFHFRVESGYSHNNNAGVYVARLEEGDDSTAVAYIRLRRSGGQYRLRLWDWNFNQKGTDFIVTRGTWAWVKIHFLSNASTGILEWWVDGTSYGGTGTIDTTARSGVGVLEAYWGAIASGAGGEGQWDNFQMSVVDHDEPDGATSPYGDDPNTGNYIGSTPTETTDIEGTSIPSGYATIGPFQIDVDPGGGGTTIPQGLSDIRRGYDTIGQTILEGSG